MAFRIKRKESVGKGVKRIIAEQIGNAEEELSDKEVDVHEAVHQARKRCKKIRALYRLVRSEIPKRVYQRENARFRDAAGELSAVRDAEAIIESYDRLMERFAGRGRGGLWRAREPGSVSRLGGSAVKGVEGGSYFAWRADLRVEAEGAS